MKTTDDSIDLLVTCPSCDHTHTVQVNERDLPGADGGERHYKLHELEKLFSVSRKTLKRWIYTGKLEAVKQGSVEGGAPWYVSETALRNFRKKYNR
jgi:hypothetical protein